MYNKENLCVRNHTNDYSLRSSQRGSIHTNLNATEDITIFLPASASMGTTFCFSVETLYTPPIQLRVDPGSAAIIDNSNQSKTPNKYIWADSMGECISFVADSNGDWLTTSKNGTWSMET